jgi:regulator of cell morphogenesis and NO signaling
MNPLVSQTLAQIVTGNHRTASVFEKYHLDFCCKGKRSLEHACQEQHIAVDELLQELESVTASGKNQGAFPFTDLTLTQLSDYIVSTHHSYVKKELPQLFQYAEKVASRHGQHHPELYVVFEGVASVKTEMEQHMMKEEEILFPRIRGLEKIAAKEPGEYQVNVSYLQSPILVMEQEHDHAGAIMAEIRQVTNNYTLPHDACTTYKLLYASLEAFEMDLHQHVHLENNILFPKAIALAKELSGVGLN